jgi:hypothetical protein
VSLEVKEKEQEMQKAIEQNELDRLAAIEYFRKNYEKKEAREITSSTYERAQKRLHKEAHEFMSRGR